MFSKINEKKFGEIEPKEQKLNKSRWWIAHSYYEDVKKKEIMKKNIDYKLSKNKF